MLAKHPAAHIAPPAPGVAAMKAKASSPRRGGASTRHFAGSHSIRRGGLRASSGLFQACCITFSPQACPERSRRASACGKRTPGGRSLPTLPAPRLRPPLSGGRLGMTNRSPPKRGRGGLEHVGRGLAPAEKRRGKQASHPARKKSHRDKAQATPTMDREGVEPLPYTTGGGGKEKKIQEPPRGPLNPK